MASGLSTKHVGETLNLGFRYHSPALHADEFITGASISASGITVGTPDISSTEVSAFVSGGTAGTDYTLRFTISTSQGQTLIDDYIVKVVT